MFSDQKNFPPPPYFVWAIGFFLNMVSIYWASSVIESKDPFTFEISQIFLAWKFQHNHIFYWNVKAREIQVTKFPFSKRESQSVTILLFLRIVRLEPNCQPKNCWTNRNGSFTFDLVYKLRCRARLVSGFILFAFHFIIFFYFILLIY